MVKLALNTIVKNEAHCIIGMLEAAAQITDLIVINDTGSTDGTQELIRNFGKEKNIPTYVFERPFDDFEKSRNYGVEKLKEVVAELGWDANNVYSWWCDADEKIIVDKKFTKNQFTKDLYMMNTQIGNSKYTRNTFVKVSRNYLWHGPVHEFIICKDPNITSGLAEGIYVDVKMIGHSWTGDISKKYLSHAHTLEKYLADDRSDPRWIFYAAQSYHDSACVKDNKEENDERLRRSIKYYRERVSIQAGYPEEIFYSQYRIGTIMRQLEEPWNLTSTELLKSYSFDNLRGEPIKVIIDHYMQVGDWNAAYLYSKFAKINFHGKNPYPQRLLFVDESLYIWKFLEAHAAACFYTQRMEEAKQNFSELKQLSISQPQYFSPEDLEKIKLNDQFFR